jgi:hypothetical protein
MKQYKNTISLNLNSRGVYCLDPSMGCASGMSASDGGCYEDCYAAKTAKLYGYDFTKTVFRHFHNSAHVKEIVRRINSINSDFVRMGCSGDPSENWDHTCEILRLIKHCNKEIVIITRHWTLLSDQQLEFISTLNLCINSSVSALDGAETMQRCVGQFERLKPYCKSVLRIVSADFNIENETGHRLAKVQAGLFSNAGTLDTVFRPSKKNKLITDGVIKASHEFFNGKKTIASKFNKKTYMGKCGTCQEICGCRVTSSSHIKTRPGIIKQLTLLPQL